MLDEQKSQELHGIVQKMIDAGEPEENVGSVIKRYTELYGQPAPSIQQKNNGTLLDKASSLADNTLGKARDFLFGSASKTIGTTIAAPILEARGMGDQANKLVKENVTPLNTVFTAIELYPGGGIVTNALKKLPGGEAVAKMITEAIPDKMKANAIKQFSEALGATTKELKAKTAQVAPKLLSSNTVVTSLKSLAEKSEEKLALAGRAVKKAENIIPVFAKQKVEPIIKSVSKMRDQFVVNGKVLDDGAVAAIDNVVQSIKQFGNEIPETQLVKIKRILDKSTAIANKNFTKDEGLSLATEAKEGIANSIRKILNSNNPKLSAANKDFHLWSDVNKIVSATLERRSTQSNGITRFIGPLIGGGTGFAAGGATKAIIGYFATDAAIKLFQSPLYKTISAINKNKLANYLASGNIKDALLLTSKLLAGIKNETTK